MLWSPVTVTAGVARSAAVTFGKFARRPSGALHSLKGYRSGEGTVVCEHRQAGVLAGRELLDEHWKLGLLAHRLGRGGRTQRQDVVDGGPFEQRAHDGALVRG